MKPWEFINRAGQVVNCVWCRTEHAVEPSHNARLGVCPNHTTNILARVNMALQRDEQNTAQPVPLRHVEQEAT